MLGYGEPFLSVGLDVRIVSVAMCPLFDLIIVCILGLGEWLAKICSFYDFPCIELLLII